MLKKLPANLKRLGIHDGIVFVNENGGGVEARLRDRRDR